VGRLEAVDMVGQRTGHFTQYVPTSNGPHKGQIWVLFLALSLVLTPFNPLLWPPPSFRTLQPRMPWLSEVSYSREATVAAVNDYFEFLASMYIAKSAILRPPEGGWPEIAADGFREALGKTD